MNRTEILGWLGETDEAVLAGLWSRADSVRRASAGVPVHLRGLVEISSHCVCRCSYCGISADVAGVSRYRLDDAQIIAAAAACRSFGYGTLVMQSGEDPGLTTGRITGLIERIKIDFGLAVTLSLGERDPDDLRRWRAAGADRYLLKLETGSASHYDLLHPGRRDGHAQRTAMLGVLRDLDYEVGTGLMVGLSGQEPGDIADGLLMLRDLDPDMISIGPYLPHPGTTLGRRFEQEFGDTADNVALTYKAMALARLLCPGMNMPCTTSLSVAAGEGGRLAGLARGANVVMLNLTPQPHRSSYEIYPSPPRSRESALADHSAVVAQIASLGCTVSSGCGRSQRFPRRSPDA